MGEGFIEVAELDGFAPGTMRCVQVRGRRVLLANVDGTIYAADELCSHEDASLCTGALQGHYVNPIIA